MVAGGERSASPGGGRGFGTGPKRRSTAADWARGTAVRRCSLAASFGPSSSVGTCRFAAPSATIRLRQRFFPLELLPPAVLFALPRAGHAASAVVGGEGDRFHGGSRAPRLQPPLPLTLFPDDPLRSESTPPSSPFLRRLGQKAGPNFWGLSAPHRCGRRIQSLSKGVGTDSATPSSHP